MTIVDSVGWIAYFCDDPLATQYEPYLERSDLLCPTVIFYEIARLVERLEGRYAADRAAAQLLKTYVVPLDEGLAVAAARVGLEHHLALADSIIYATTLTFGATLVTSDAHFQGLPHVVYYPRQGTNHGSIA